MVTVRFDIGFAVICCFLLFSLVKCPALSLNLSLEVLLWQTIWEPAAARRAGAAAEPPEEAAADPVAAAGAGPAAVAVAASPAAAAGAGAAAAMEVVTGVAETRQVVAVLPGDKLHTPRRPHQNQRSN